MSTDWSFSGSVVSILRVHSVGLCAYRCVCICALRWHGNMESEDRYTSVSPWSLSTSQLHRYPLEGHTHSHTQQSFLEREKVLTSCDIKARPRRPLLAAFSLIHMYELSVRCKGQIYMKPISPDWCDVFRPLLLLNWCDAPVNTFRRARCQALSQWKGKRRGSTSTPSPPHSGADTVGHFVCPTHSGRQEMGRHNYPNIYLQPSLLTSTAKSLCLTLSPVNDVLQDI